MKLVKLFLVVFSIVLVGRMFAEPYRFSGDCMEPEFKDGSLSFLNRVLPLIRSYRIGDVVAYKHEEKVWISRIVALSGDKVLIKEGEILVNGVALEDNVNRLWPGWNYGYYGIDEEVVVPEGFLYVLSDKLAAQHDDSRVFGPISKKEVIGIIWTDI